jgi:hypothetical protein
MLVFFFYIIQSALYLQLIVCTPTRQHQQIFFGEILFVLSVNDMFPPSVIAQAITPTLFAGFNLLWMFSLILLIVDKQ